MRLALLYKACQSNFCVALWYCGWDDACILHDKQLILWSHADSSSSFLPDMSLDSRMYLHMHGVWQPSMNSLAASEDLHPD